MFRFPSALKVAPTLVWKLPFSVVVGVLLLPRRALTDAWASPARGAIVYSLSDPHPRTSQYVGLIRAPSLPPRFISNRIMSEWLYLDNGCSL